MRFDTLGKTSDSRQLSKGTRLDDIKICYLNHASISSPAVDGGYGIDIVHVGAIGIDISTIPVAASKSNGLMGGNSVIRTLIGICVSRICGERTSEIELLVGDLLDFLANEVISGHADTAVSVPVIEREPGAPDTDSSDSDIPSLTEATVLIEIFVESTFGWDKENARKGCKIVGFSHGALSAVGAVISVVSEGEVAIGADTGLSIDGVNLVEKAFDEYALTADESKSSTASTCVKLGEVGLVDGTTLANILDDDKSRETFAESIDKMLVDTTGINANTLLQDGVIFISLSTFTTVSIDGDKANIAVAVEGVDVEYLIDSAAIASDVSAITYFHGGFTAWMVTAEVVVVGKSSNC